jgi:hypothetical protein
MLTGINSQLPPDSEPKYLRLKDSYNPNAEGQDFPPQVDSSTSKKSLEKKALMVLHLKNYKEAESFRQFSTSTSIHDGGLR